MQIVHQYLDYIQLQNIILKLDYASCIIRCVGGDTIMAIKYKVNIIDALREAGYTSYKIGKEGLINQTALQKLRKGELIAWGQFDTVCRLLNTQPGDLIEYVNDNDQM